eukprot:CAMPEP_0173426438 /NCGR_PEP_ID=MMETSP1357-20121228/5901_1 /TAXON_ID=77926 /ORGANISM="Hemiselmis rufescens, Strain PCC563" /LENGTH=158 /DNA_ID=CAMNT_0014390099 /DNA_START=4 /DNA_END=477 /DNA_ORIENTATION=-
MAQYALLGPEDKANLKAPEVWEEGRRGTTECSASTVKGYIENLAQSGEALKPFAADGVDGYVVTDGDLFRAKINSWKEEHKYKSKPRNILHTHFKNVMRGQWFETGAVLVPVAATGKDAIGEAEKEESMQQIHPMAPSHMPQEAHEEAHEEAHDDTMA